MEWGRTFLILRPLVALVQRRFAAILQRRLWTIL
jgi:hypothetical protein